MALRKFDEKNIDYGDEKEGKMSATKRMQLPNPKLLQDLPNPFKPMTIPEKSNYLKTSMPPFAKASDYTLINRIGFGTFGDVYKAHVGTDGSQVVAMKKIKMVNETYEAGFPLTALREVQILKKLKHLNVVKLIEVACKTETNAESRRISFTYYLVLEYCEHDLGGVLQKKSITISQAENKSLIKQLVIGTEFMHSQDIIHRDLKTANVLLNKHGQLKLADMGLARDITKPLDSDFVTSFTNCVVTLWYRAPELLLGDTKYGFGVDIWSLGLIIGEIWLRDALLQGKNDIHQLKEIANLCGSITLTSCPSAYKYRLFKDIKLPENEPRTLVPKLQNFVHDIQCLKMIDHMLNLEPGKRLSAAEALSHKYFHTLPVPGDLRLLVARINGSCYSNDAATH